MVNTYHEDVSDDNSLDEKEKPPLPATKSLQKMTKPETATVVEMD